MKKCSSVNCVKFQKPYMTSLGHTVKCKVECSVLMRFSISEKFENLKRTIFQDRVELSFISHILR